MNVKTYFIVGGAGFIGSHFADFLLQDSTTTRVTLFDNFSSGRHWHYEAHTQDSRFRVVRGDAKNLSQLIESMPGHHTIIHLASNPDIARAATEPDIDFREGTLLTQNVVEAMRVSKAKQILYASGSGVYGELGHTEAHEDFGPLIPISTYGASKLAGEALISSYCYMFGMTGVAFRFGNVVGPRQTHGVGFDFIRKLMNEPSSLEILGDGTQSKSYVHIEDIRAAVLLAATVAEKPFQVYNVATGDYISVKEIAHLAIECLQLDPSHVSLRFTGGDRGWKGDVPIVRLSTERIQHIGWKCRRNSREALKAAILAMIPDMKAGKLEISL